MSDFFNSGWSIGIAAVTLLSLLFCLVLLVIASRRQVMANDNTTGHIWDEDLREMNNPLPRWWMGLFILTVVFSVAYLVIYPGLGSHPGALKWSSTGQHADEMTRAREQMAPLYARFVAMPAEALVKDAPAMAIGERLYANNCAQCHGSDARGSKGFPNLTDADWLYGGQAETIRTTITNGRQGNMPALGAALGGPEGVRQVAQYVLSLSGSPHDAAAAQVGQAKFVVCAACHGIDGKGNPALGAPNLTDKVWLHGGGEASIVSIINNGKVNVMPAQRDRLNPEQIHVLGAYVMSLSQGTPVSSQ